MESEKYISEFRPQYRLQFEEPAPLGTKCIFLTPYGSAVVGHWYSGCEFVAWSPLPKLTAVQHEKIEKHLERNGGSREFSSSGVDTASPVDICCKPRIVRHADTSKGS